MPKIPIIQNELSPSFQPGSRRGVEPVDFSGVARSAFQVQSEFERRDAEAQRQAERLRDLQERQADDEARVAVSGAMSLAHADWTERLIASQQKAPADAAGFTTSTMQEFDTWAEQTEQGLPERGRNLFRTQANGFRVQVHERAIRFETGARQAKLVSDVEVGLDADRRVVWADPSQYETAVQARVGAIESLNLPAAERERQRSKAVDALAYTAAMGLVRSDPSAVLRRLGYGYSPGDLDVTSQDQGEWQIPPDVQAERDTERLRILEAEAIDPQYSDDDRAAVRREIATVKSSIAARPTPRRAPPLKTEKVDISKDPVFRDLSPERLDAIATHALSAARQQEAVKRSEAAATVAEGTKLARGVMSAWDSGYPQDPSIITRAKQLVAGSPMETEFAQAEARFGQTQQFRLMSPTQQQQFLDVTRSQATTPDGAVLHEKLTSIKASADAEIKRDAFSYGAKLLNLAPAAVDWASPQTVAQSLPARVQQAAVISARLGVEVAPITVQEAEAWGNHVEALPPQQRSQNIAEMTQVMGPQASGALARTVSEKNKPLGLAIGLGADGTTAGRYASELVLRGQQAIKDKTVKIEGGAEVGWRAQIAKDIGDAYPSEDMRRDMVEAAYLANIGMAAEGQSDPARAVRIITGGLVDRNGAKVPLPRGVSADDFDRAVRGASVANVLGATDGQVYVRGQAVPVADFLRSLPDARLVHAGQGRYSVQAGGALVLNARGQRVLVRFP